MSRATTRRIGRIADIPAEAWDALVGDDDPFAEHAFHAALEESGSVGPGTGWEPCHLLVEREGALVAALPLYRKLHSYGEYIFDFAWANAAQRARIRYYPKLVSMAPFTPATGRRILAADAEADVLSTILDAVVRAVDEDRASSAHLLFLDVRERDAVARDRRFLPRLSHQYHFHNEGYRDFDDLLARFRSEARKQVKRERRAVVESGLRIETKTGPELTVGDWEAIGAFYADTCERKGSMPYLRPAFFDVARTKLAHRAVAVLAYDGTRPVAMSLSFEKGKRLYGRYWGAEADYDRLHFELCYYRLLDRAIERGCDRFEAGAQGEHKIKRGLLPTTTHSAHFIAHEGLRAAIADFLPHEARGVHELVEELSSASPFRRA